MEDQNDIHNHIDGIDLIRKIKESGLMSKDDREAFDMLSQGYSYKEIAEKQGISQTAVGTRIQRARDKIKKNWVW